MVAELRAVWRAAAEAHARAGRGAEAARAHEALARAAPHDRRSLARLVRALGAADPRARRLAARLPPVSELEVRARRLCTPTHRGTGIV